AAARGMARPFAVRRATRHGLRTASARANPARTRPCDDVRVGVRASRLPAVWTAALRPVWTAAVRRMADPSAAASRPGHAGHPALPDGAARGLCRLRLSSWSAARTRHAPAPRPQTWNRTGRTAPVVRPE